MPSTEKGQKEREEKMLAFKLWLQRVPDWWLRNQVIDAFWHG